QCPPGHCTHRRDVKFPPGAGFSASPGTDPVRQPFSHKEPHSNRWHSCYRTSSCCFDFFSGLRGGIGRFSPSSTEGRVLLATTDSGWDRLLPSRFSSVSSSTRRADFTRRSSS